MEAVFKMPDLQGVISENDPEFESKATEVEKRAVDQATEGASLEKLQSLPHQSTAKQELVRREQGLRVEKKEEETEYYRLNGEIRAKYKIEVTFVQGRTTNGPNKLGIQIWESGKHFHGGGDELAYWCKDNRQGHDEGCWGIITGDYIKGDTAFCKGCGKMMNAELLTNMKIGNVTTQALAQECTKLFRQLGSNADIYLKFHKSDIHYIAMERAKGPEVAARLKGMHIYPLKNILKDTAHGADVTKRFLAFLTS